MKSRIFWIIFLLCAFTTGFAQEQQEKEINDQAQFWTSVNSTWRISTKWGAMGDFHLRRNNFLKDPNFYFLRLGAVYWFNNKFSLAGGGALLWLATPDSEGDFNYALERRIYQQLLWRSVQGKVKNSKRATMAWSAEWRRRSRSYSILQQTSIFILSIHPGFWKPKASSIGIGGWNIGSLRFWNRV